MWREFHAYFKPTATDANLRVCFNGFCQQSITVWLAGGSLTLPKPLWITTENLADGRVGEVYNQTLNTDGGVGNRTWTVVSGSRPSGLTLRSTGVLAGVPTVAGTNIFRVQAKDVAGTTATRDFTLVIAPGVTVTPEIAWANPADIVYGTALGEAQLNAAATTAGTNVPGSYVYVPAPGTVLNAGEAQTLSVTFTPSAAGLYAPASGVAVINVLRAPVTAAASHAERLVGQANPTFTGTLSGVVNGDPISATFASDANETSPAGTYDILPALHDPDGRLGNYEATLVKATLTVRSWVTPTLRVGITESTVTLQIASSAGLQVEIQTTDDLSAGWTRRGTVTLTDDVGTWTDPQPTLGSVRFYRVQVR